MRINSKILSTIFHTNKEEINKYCSHLEIFPLSCSQKR